MNNMINSKLLMSSIAAILVIGFSAPAFAAEDSYEGTGGVATVAEFGAPGTWYIQEWDGTVPWFEHPFPAPWPTLTPPFQFNCGAASCTLTVTDDGAFANDQFDVYSNTVLLGTTSVPAGGIVPPCPGSAGYFTNPDACVADPNHSSGSFCIGAGVNTIKIINILAQAGQISDGFLKIELDETAQCQPVAGEYVPINNSALLIAGVSANAVWILPLLAGFAGAGIYLARSKFDWI